jgi:hypothetical protein
MVSPVKTKFAGIKKIQIFLTKEEFQTLFVETISQYRFLLGYEKPSMKDTLQWNIFASLMYNPSEEFTKTKIIKFFNNSLVDFKIENEIEIDNQFQKTYEDEFIYYKNA